jgi:hypothetical protein
LTPITDHYSKTADGTLLQICIIILLETNFSMMFSRKHIVALRNTYLEKFKHQTVQCPFLQIQMRKLGGKSNPPFAKEMANLTLVWASRHVPYLSMDLLLITAPLATSMHHTAQL